MDGKFLRGLGKAYPTDLRGFLLKASQGDQVARLRDEEFGQVYRVMRS